MLTDRYIRQSWWRAIVSRKRDKKTTRFLNALTPNKRRVRLPQGPTPLTSGSYTLRPGGNAWLGTCEGDPLGTVVNTTAVGVMNRLKEIFVKGPTSCGSGSACAASANGQQALQTGRRATEQGNPGTCVYATQKESDRVPAARRAVVAHTVRAYKSCWAQPNLMHSLSCCWICGSQGPQKNPAPWAIKPVRENYAG